MAGRYELFGRCLDRCESFIERRFAIALLFSEEFTFAPRVGSSVVIAEDRYGIVLGQQVPVSGYRLDFALKHRDTNSRIAIELDGHTFHDAVPAIAERDRTRDRALLAVGWRTARFTGREVVRDAVACARQAHALMLAVSSGTPLPLAKTTGIRPQLSLRSIG